MRVRQQWRGYLMWRPPLELGTSSGYGGQVAGNFCRTCSSGQLLLRWWGWEGQLWTSPGSELPCACISSSRALWLEREHDLQGLPAEQRPWGCKMRSWTSRIK